MKLMQIPCEEWHTPTSYTVGSETRVGISFGVELLSYRGFGQCDCEHWKFNLAPVLHEHGPEGLEPCKHIIRARIAFAEKALARMAEMEIEGNLSHGGDNIVVTGKS